MRKKLVAILLCFIPLTFIACGENKDDTNSVLSKTETVSSKGLTFDSLTEAYEKEGLKLTTKADNFNDYTRNLLSDTDGSSDETNRAGVFSKGNKVVRSFISCSTEKGNENRFNSLLDVLFPSIMPEFKDYKTWVSDMIPICMKDEKKEYHWNKDGMQIRISFNKAHLIGRDNVDIEIVDEKEIDGLFKKADDMALNEKIELNKDGKVPGNEVKEESSLKAHFSKNTRLFDEVFAKIAGLDKDATIIFLQGIKANATIDKDGGSIIVKDPAGSENKVIALYKDTGTLSMITCFNGDRTVSAFYDGPDLAFMLDDKTVVKSIDTAKKSLLDN